MEKTDERRAERRLRYRWPVRFVSGAKEKPISGQMFDVCSRGMAFLCHPEQSSIQKGRQITADFGVPHFDSDSSFDAVFFSRNGRVCRVDTLSEQVCRIAIRFAEPLFFKPGEQNISESDSEQRLKARALSVVKAEEKVRVYTQALGRAKERIMYYARAKVEAQEKLKAEIEEKVRAQEKAKLESCQRIKAEKNLKAEVKKWAKLEAELMKKIKSYEETIEKLEAKAKENADSRLRERTKIKVQDVQPEKQNLLKKVDKFVTDKGRIY
jgi:hypothetical protein